ncbi:MAG: shikimate kinase [Rhodospirillaceae bacterium]|nr:shikimate kinase [Rhodospirillaceae bacterium]MBT6139687.1 shikimate kinase [Rhodospirillaceae bacterium]
MPSELDPEGKLPPLERSIVLVGLMGAGKTAIGKRLAERLGVSFIDADHEIERAADSTINEIFERYGEDEFRQGERRVIARLLSGPPKVLATGGGAFMAQETREAIRENGVSVWLKADLEVLFERVSRRSHRPLLKTGNPRDILRDLMDKRYPVYAEADLTVETFNGPIEATVDRVYAAVLDQLRISAMESNR